MTARRIARWAAVLGVLPVIALTACTSNGTSSASNSSAAGISQTVAGGAEATTAEPTSEPPAPASTAQMPVASYPADPGQDPHVELGPPPPAYQAPRPECPPEARACVDLTNSMTWVQENGAVIYGPVQQIAGRQGYRTTPGMHTVFWKNIDHVSSIFGTPMPYATFFTKTGMAFHEGALDVPSHGCVHLTHADAAAYWDLMQNGDTVYVFGEARY